MTALCKCGHLPEHHRRTRRLCLGSPVCACAEYRPTPDTRDNQADPDLLGPYGLEPDGDAA